MKDYRRLTEDEILQLKSQSCLADDWGNVSVAEGFNCEYVHHTRFSVDFSGISIIRLLERKAAS